MTARPRALLPVPSPAIARLYLLAGAILWSSGGFFIKEIDAGALSITFFRCLFAAADLSKALNPMLYVGRSVVQVDEFVKHTIGPIRERYTGKLQEKVQLKV